MMSPFVSIVPAAGWWRVEAFDEGEQIEPVAVFALDQEGDVYALTAEAVVDDGLLYVPQARSAAAVRDAEEFDGACTEAQHFLRRRRERQNEPPSS